MSDRPLAPRPPWEGRRVVLGVTGGIAAYKAVQLARDLTRLGAAVDVVLTRSSTEFVTPLTFQGVTGRPVLSELFSVDGAALHIRLGAEADLVMVAPATADLIARAAHGRADDLLTTTLLATRAPVLLAPAMNDRMYSHPQTQSNLAHCRDALGYRIAGPGTGPLAVGEADGPGRMLEPGELVDHAGRTLAGSSAVSGRKVLVTAGPTREALDPVRYFGNRSSGRMGFHLAREAWLRGGEVTLVTGPSHLPDPVGVRTVRVETAQQMAEAAREHASGADLLVFAAAVADYRPEKASDAKVKREVKAEFIVTLVENPDVSLAALSERAEGSIAVGFALETDDLLENALEKLERKGFDLIVANAAGEPDSGFEAQTNRVHILDREGNRTELPRMGKDLVASAILDRAAPFLERGVGTLPSAK